MATRGDQRRGAGPRPAGADPGAPNAIVVDVLDDALPDHVLRTLRSSVGARPERSALSLTPRPDERILRRLAEAKVRPRDLRFADAHDDPRVERHTERLIDAFTRHCQFDLRIPSGRCEAMAQALGYLFWFQRRFAQTGPLALAPDVVRSCFGHDYIKRGAGDRPVLTWIHYGLRGAATFGAFTVRAGWCAPKAAEGLMALPDEAEWFRSRLHTYWVAEGDDWRAWLKEADPCAL